MKKKILSLGIVTILVIMLVILTGCESSGKKQQENNVDNSKVEENKTYQSDNWKSFYDEEKGLNGFKDENGNMVINAIYKTVEEYENGFAIVSKDLETTNPNYDPEWRYAYYGLINENGEEVVECKYKYMSYDEDEKLYLVNEDNGTVISGNLYYINAKGEKVKEW